MNKFKKEPYITQRQGANGWWTFQVYIRTEYDTITKSFSEKDYGSARLAYEAAIQYRDKTRYEIANNTLLKKNNVTLREVFEEYYNDAVCSLNTKEYHRKLFNKYINHKDKKIQELTKADIISDLNKMVMTSSDDTISRVFYVYKEAIVGTALLKDYLVRDITLGIKKPVSQRIMVRRGVGTDRETVLKVEELILKSVKNKYEAQIIVYLLEVLYFTGMRPAEAEVLTRNDIKDNYISVTKELGSSINDQDVVRRCKTESSIRNIPIHQNLVPVLKELKKFSLHDTLFARENGTYMNSTYIGNIIRNVCKANDIEFNMYRLRHNVATSLVTNNVDSRTTMEILGHTHYNMSLYYASSNDDLKDDAMDLIH